ncbi:uncharacterized protein LOC107045503 [Diachasma alloeum]|uniref:uncharacterized protein LOC107045503 n=1 Tax=Diachasma alloeum TaxID=454923 RepID=UPI0007382FD6|nr:uncharacterized protein LOC107045503 [Diachasma alloeum]
MRSKKLVSEHWVDLGKMPNEKMNTWHCKWCKHKRKHHSTRMIEHLAENCVHCPENVSIFCKSRLSKKEKSTSKGNKKRKRAEMSDDSSDDSSDNESISSASSSKSNASQSSQHSVPIVPDRGPTLDGFCDKISVKDQLKAQYLLAFAIFASGSPLSLTENSFWITFFRFLRPKFECPFKWILSNVLLDQVYNAVKTEINRCIENAKTVNLQCDGWTNLRSEGIVNFGVTTPLPAFFASIIPGTDSESGEWIAAKLISQIKKIGARKIISVCTDNASAMKKAWKIVEEEYIELAIAAVVFENSKL